MKKETIQIANKTCTIYKSEHPEYLLIQPIDEHDLEVLDNEVATIESLANLSFIKEILIPQLKRMQLFKKDKMRCVLGGYSLAGFFALWSAYQTKLFGGIAAVSPSVWYPQWMEYAEKNRPLATSVYLSLGDKEEKTKNPIMAQVGNCIRKQKELLTAQGVNTILEWNPGNHFQHSDERTAKGFAWIINLD